MTRYEDDTGYALKYEKIDPNRLQVNGVVSSTSLSTTLTDLKYIKNYFVQHKDSDDPDYLFICFDYTNDLWYPFYDDDETYSECARGWFKGINDTWNQSRPQVFAIQILFEVIWSD